MADVRNRLPGTIQGSRAWSGNPPSSFLSGDGSVFYGRNEKDANRIMWYRVYSVAPDGAITDRLLIGPGEAPGCGQGLLAVDAGWLIVTVYPKAGDGIAAERYAVPGWVRHS